MPEWLGLLIGIVLVVLTWTIIVFSVVVPRALRGPGRLSVYVNRATRWIFFRVSRLARTYEGKDAVLSSIGPVALLAQLVVWLFLIGVACVFMVVPYTHDLGAAASQVGAAMFTLGDRTLHGLVVGDIELQHLGAGKLARCSHRRVYPVAACGQCQRGSPSDAGAASGDEDDLLGMIRRP
jgi:hypothetical protein